MADLTMVRCPTCGAQNRVPANKLREGLKPVCGRCRNPLAVTLDSRPVTITDANFAQQVERSPIPVLLDLWAPWCGPCRTLAPTIDELAAEMAGRLRVGKLNVDENPVTASRLQVRSIPLLVLFRDGQEVNRLVGAQSKSTISSLLQQILA